MQCEKCNGEKCSGPSLGDEHVGALCAGYGVWLQLGSSWWPGIVAVCKFVKSSIDAGGAAGMTRNHDRWQARYFGGIAGSRNNGAGTAEIQGLQGIRKLGNRKRREKTEHPLEIFQT